MKTPIASAWIPGLVLVMVWLPGGFAQNETDRTAPRTPEATPLATPASAAPRQLAPQFPAITAPNDPSLPTPPPARSALVTKRQPPRIRLSPWTSEIVKLAESGIENEVIFSFIENAGTFNLGAEQIVYLNDLGLSSELITGMLRHDQEIISGLRPLTIASVPDWEPEFDSTLTMRGSASSKTIPQPATAPSLPTAAEPARTPSQEIIPGVKHAVANTHFAATQQAVADELAPVRSAFFSQQRQAFERKISPYRVREPYPEEITAPIILIGESRTPNTMIVVGFPRTTP